ncbi:MAG: A/G-specific adenine glycosylase [Candidatus Krumholzibacteriota bacterium]|nr:A/G-specific adenine glycosylase [Candidatus Krumholzibacteriota bacterium]
MTKLTQRDVREFRRTVLDAYAERGRPGLPWRLTNDPWLILVSEMMLQQTQVPRVAERYGDFCRRFPAPADLARAGLDEVLAAWSGLGYNRRAMYLHRAARVIVERHGGAVPERYGDLLALPGIGPAAAGGIAAFAFGLAHPFIETNIRAVFIHHFFPGRREVRDAEILPLVERTLDRDDPRTWYYALMDYGVELKRRDRGITARGADRSRQAPFAGSDREARGRVVRALTSGGGMTIPQLAAATGLEREPLERVVARLVSEGMLERRGGRVRVDTSRGRDD